MTINCKGELVSLDYPRVMGILNHTPDSFFEGSRVTEKTLLNRAEEMLIQGADFIDVGGYSTRPNAAEVSEEEELGAAIINDISAGGLDPQMLKVVAEAQVPYIAMHMRGTPQTKQQHTDYNYIITDMLYYFSERKTAMMEMGINDVIIDVGFGFSKTLDQNYEILKHLERFQILKAPLLVGLSRKSMLYKLLDTDPVGALNATTIANTIALLKGAHIIRVHDVKEAKECVKIISKIR